MKKLRTLLHRWHQSRLNARADRRQLELDDYAAIEQAKINRLRSRALHHEEQVRKLTAKPVGQGLAALIPMAKPQPEGKAA